MYLEIKPSIELKDSIDTFWFFSNDKSDEKFKVMPDACTDIIVDLNQNKSFLSATMTTFQQIEVKAQSSLIGVRFKAEKFGSLSAIPLHEVKDLRVELSELFPKFNLNLITEMNGSKTIEKKICVLEDFVSNALNLSYKRRDKLIIAVAQRIRRLNGNLNIEELSKIYHISLRQLQRRFKSYIGLTIKEFSSIIRFKNAEMNIKSNPELSFMQIAFTTGFYDHAHMNHEFKRITGENPTHFR